MAVTNDEEQKEIKDALVQADEEALRAIYAYLAPVELSLSPEQDAALRGYVTPLMPGEPRFYSWVEMKAALMDIANGCQLMQ